MDLRDLNQHEKIALLLLSLGEELASQILRKLNKRDVPAITQAMQRMGQVEQSKLAPLVKELEQVLRKAKEPLITGGEDITQVILTKAFGVNGQKSLDIESSRITALDDVEVSRAAALLSREQPQTLALIMAHLAPEHSSELLGAFSPELRTELVLRIAKLEPVGKDVLKELNDSLKERLAKEPRLAQPSIKGVEQVAKLLQTLDPTSAERILEEIEKRDPQLNEDLGEAMFVFDDLASLLDRHLRTLYQSVPIKTWATALLETNNPVLPKIRENISERAKESLEEEMAAVRGRTRKSELREAQKRILEHAKTLLADGSIERPNPKDPYV